MLKICEEKDGAEVEKEVRALALIRRISCDERVPLKSSAFTRPAPVVYPIRAGIKDEDDNEGEEGDQSFTVADDEYGEDEHKEGEPEERHPTQSEDSSAAIARSPYIFTCPAVSPRPMVIYQFISGVVAKRSTPPVLSELARGLAQLHAIPLRCQLSSSHPASSSLVSLEFLSCVPFGMFDIEPQFIRQIGPVAEMLEKVAEARAHPIDPSDASHTPNADWSYHPFIQFLLTRLPQIRTAIQLSPTLPQSVLHSDLFLENALFDKRSHKLLALIDFEEMGRGPRVLDVAMTIVGCCYDYASQSLQLDQARTFLHAYARFTPLTAEEVEHFKVFLMWALMAIAYWRFQNFNVAHPELVERRDSWSDMTRRIQQLEEPHVSQQIDAVLREISRNQ